MKKHIKIIAILFLVTIVFEMLMVAYNQIIYKVYDQKHLINNEPYTIAIEDITFRKEGATNIVGANKKFENVYNLSLNLKKENGDAYITIGCNDKSYTLKRDNIQATKFKVYFGKSIDIEKFEIYFNETQLDLENVKDITINENVSYMPQKGIMISRMVTIFSLSIIAYLIFCLSKKLSKRSYKIDKAKFFVVAALILGIGIGTLVIPLTQYDEHTHFWRAYELSKGNIISRWENLLPKSVIGLVIDENNEYHLYDRKYSDLKENLTKELNPKDEEGLFVGGAGAYSPFNYIPQLVGITIGRIINTNPMIIAYLGRLTNFISFILLIYMSIKLIPKEKWKNIVIVVALLPMTLNLATSLSPDCLAISLSILLVSYILNMKYKKEKMKNTQICLLAILCIATSLVKIAYLPLIILFLLIPSEKFKNKKIYYLVFVAILLISIVVNLLWMSVANKGGTAAIRTNSEEQVFFVLSNPLDFVTNMIYTIMENINDYISTMLGGWNTTAFGTILLILIVCLTTFSRNENENCKGEEEVTLSKKDKIVIAFSLICVLFLIFAGLYIQWTVATFNRVEGIQGRYFLPILVPILILFESDKLKINIKNYWIKYFIILLFIYIPVYINIIKEYL